MNEWGDILEKKMSYYINATHWHNKTLLEMGADALSNTDPGPWIGQN